MSGPGTAAEAVATMKHWHDTNYGVGLGECLHTCRTAWKLSGGENTAADQWNDTPPEHRHSGPAPFGAPVFWTGGSSGAGHVAISDGQGSVWSTDLPTEKRVGHVTVATVVKEWPNHTLVGWTNYMEKTVLPVS